MSAKIKRLIRSVFKDVEDEEPSKSIEYLFEITRQRLSICYRVEVDASDIAEALEP